MSAWEWPARTLVIVDYAAAKAAILRPWLVELAQRASPTDAPLRILLLERHASEGTGWWAELTRPGGWHEDPTKLLDPPEPIALPSLTAPEDLRCLLADVMMAASDIAGRSPHTMPPARGADPHFDTQLATPDPAFAPLYLAMSAIVAVREGSGNLLRLGRADLAQRIAATERARLENIARGRGLGPELIWHMAACVTMTGGAPKVDLVH